MWAIVLSAWAAAGPALPVARPVARPAPGALLRVWTNGDRPLTGALVRATPAALTVRVDNREVDLPRATIKRIDVRERTLSRRTRVFEGIALGLAGSVIIRPRSAADRNRLRIGLPVLLGSVAALVPTGIWRRDVPLNEFFGPR
jgi:hypothetical protein